MSDTYQISPEQGGNASSSQGSGRTAYHGRVARMRDGSRAVWQEPVNGRGGRFVRLSESTAAPQAREQLQADRDRLSRLDRLDPLSRDIVRLGNNTATGGWRARSYMREAANSGDWWNGVNFPVQMMDHGYRSRLEQMKGLEDQAVTSSVEQGTSGAFNTPIEQNRLLGMIPSANFLGSTNSQRAARLATERGLAQERVRAAEQWLTQHTDLSNFDAAWQASEPEIRQRLELQFGQEFGTAPGARIGSSIGSRAGLFVRRRRSTQAPPRPPGVPPQAVWDGQSWVAD